MMLEAEPPATHSQAEPGNEDEAFSHVGAPHRKTGNILPQRPRRSQSRVHTIVLRDLRGLCGKIDILYIILGYWRHLSGKTAPGVKIIWVDALTIANDTLTSLAKTWRYEKRHWQCVSHTVGTPERIDRTSTAEASN